MECEMEEAVVEVEAILDEIVALLLGGHRTGVTNKRKFVEWRHIPAAVNTPDSETQPFLLFFVCFCVFSVCIYLCQVIIQRGVVFLQKRE